MWTAVSLGSPRASMLIGFTAVYREGFETALFYQALLVVRAGPRRVDRCSASRLGLVALAGGVVRDLQARARLPVRRSCVAVVLLMADVDRVPRQRGRELQEADVIGYHRARRLAAPADLPGPGHRLLPDA